MAVMTEQPPHTLTETLDFRTLFESVPGLFLVLKPDFTIAAASHAYLRAARKEREDIVGRGVFEAFPDDPHEPAATGVRNLRASLLRVRELRVSDTMALQKHEIRRPDADGGGFEERYWRPVNSPVFERTTGELLYIVHRIEDVTGIERLSRLEAEVREAEDRSRALMNSAPDAIVVTDREGRIVLVNNRTETLLGYPREELLGKTVEILLPERLRAAHSGHRAAYMRAPSLRPMGANLELCARRSDGVELPVEISLSPMRTSGGLEIACAIRDISDRRHALEELRQARNEAEKANSAKSAFLATASHDLRQPVQALSLLNGVLQKLVTDEDAADALAQQSSAIGSMSRLLNALLDISKLESGAVKPQLETWNAATLLRSLRSEFSGLAVNKGLKLEFDAGDAWVRSNETLIGQVLRNLVTNAIKYTKHGRVLLRSAQSGPMVRLEVRDTGVGMAAEDLSRIYDEFYQIGVSPNASRDGYGLGLSIVSRIVKLLGLHLDVQSTPGKGSIFALQLPAAEAAKDAMAHASAAGTAGSAAQRAGKHILLVEDDAGVRNATRLLLKAEGYQVAVSSSVAEAVQQARAMPAIDLILSDYHLAGGETGVQAVRAVRELRNRTIQAVMMSGDTSSAIKALGPDQDFHIVSKPIDSDALLRVVGELLFR